MDLDVTRPFSRKDALAAGVTPRQLAGPGYERLHRGIYVLAGTQVTLSAELKAIMDRRPGLEFASHGTAARLYGAVVPDSPRLHFGADDGWGHSRELVTGHRYAKRPKTTTRWGVPVTTAEQTFWDLRHELDLVDLVVLGDSLVGRTATTPEKLIEFCRGQGSDGGKAGAKARRAAGLVRVGVDSPRESQTRMLWTLAGLPEVEVDLRFFTADGDLLRRLDMGIRKLKFALEYDGRQHVDRKEQWTGDITRREDFENDGWTFLIAVNDDVYRRPDKFLRRAVMRLAKCGMPVEVRSDEWRRYFPVRKSPF